MRLNSVEQKGYANRIMDWKIFVRQDLVAAKASEFFYEFVGENSFRPVSELLLPEDGELLKKAVEADTFQPLELITVLHNLKDSVRNVYLRLEQSEQTENGIPLYQITVSDIHDLENRNLRLEQSILKYRHFMTLEDVYFFEYLIEQDSITVYKYVNERAMNQFEGPMNALIRNVEQAHEGSDISRLEDQLRTFCAHLRNGDDFFEMEFVSGQEDKGIWKVKGARIPKKRDMVAGIITQDRNREKEAYYLTPAARDAGTGLLNKRAWTEYTIEQLNRKDHSTRWLVIIDIDDFKHINDTYGHIFGDQVIRRVAEIMQVLVGQRGVIGRFGGDEYVILLEKVETREQLKTLLKTIAKEFALAFDPKTHATASIGVSEYPVDGSEYEELMRKADKALYLAKEKGKNRHIIYEERLHGKLESDDMQNMAMASGRILRCWLPASLPLPPASVSSGSLSRSPIIRSWGLWEPTWRSFPEISPTCAFPVPALPRFLPVWSWDPNRAPSSPPLEWAFPLSSTSSFFPLASLPEALFWPCSRPLLPQP